MTEKTHTLRLEIDARPAKEGAARFKNAVKSVQIAVGDLERSTEGAFTQLTRADPKGLRRVASDARSSADAINRTGSASRRAAEQMQRMALSSAAALRTSQNESQRLSQRLGKLGNKASVDRLNADLERLKTNLTQAQSNLDIRAARSQFADTSAELKRYASDLENLARAEAQASSAAARREDQLQRLRAAHDPLFAASKQYEQSLDEIARLERQGAISASVAGGARERAAMQLQNAGNQAIAYGRQAQVSGFHTANLAAQFNDIGVMLASGQSPLLLALQQGTQVSQVLNQMGGQGQALAALRAGFLSMINPVSLATIGIIAGGAALGQWAISALGAEDASSQLEERLSSLKTLSTNLDANLDILSLSAQELAQKYGEAADRVREFAVFQAGLRISKINALITEQTSVLQDSADKYVSLTNAGRTYRNTLERIARNFGVSTTAARQFESALQQAAFGETFDKQVAGLREVRRLLKESGISASDLPPELAKALIKMIDLSAESDAAKKAASDLADAVTDIAPGLTPAVSEASRLKSELAAALALKNRIAYQETLTYSGRGDDPRKFMNGPTYQAELGYQSPGAIISEIQQRTSNSGSASSSTGDYISRARERIATMNEENTALRLLTQNVVESGEAAEFLARAMTNGSTMADRQTAALVRQIDAAVRTKTALEALADDPVKRWREGVASWEQGARQIETQVLQSLSREIANFVRTGEFSFDRFAGSIIGKAAEIMANQFVLKLLNSFGGTVFGGFLAPTTVETGVFREGGYTTAPVASAVVPAVMLTNVPQYAEGTANTSGGMPAILHDNEAVVPLSRGRKIPVELGGAGAGGGMHVSVGDIHVSVESVEDDTPEDQGQRIADMLSASLDHKIEEKMAQHVQYGGMFYPRSG